MLPPYLIPNYPPTSTNWVQCAFEFSDDTVSGQNGCIARMVTVLPCSCRSIGDRVYIGQSPPPTTLALPPAPTVSASHAFIQTVTLWNYYARLHNSDTNLLGLTDLIPFSRTPNPRTSAVPALNAMLAVIRSIFTSKGTHNQAANIRDLTSALFCPFGTP
ncbi:hypothetical protein CLF_108974 [Clonorchis sinensis]|uniref:Uncharacterized protein n=1 Tax=Clonorchis sinensis TaxID=79923 RepID=G7YIS7_CLOSI|nr:hypothetical protein CLF_108974 [Clonorchis sinensis]